MRTFFSMAAFLVLILASCARLKTKQAVQLSEPRDQFAGAKPAAASDEQKDANQKTKPKAASERQNRREWPSEPSYREGSLAKDEPQAIYSSDPNDAWNRVFYRLFTRRVKVRVSEDFPDAGPFQSLDAPSPFSSPLSVSERLLERIESGDRAIDPFYPFGPLGARGARSRGVINALTEPRFGQLERGLRDALEQTEQRPPLQRALLQSDVWAAYDILHKHYISERASEDSARCARIMVLAAKLVKKLALKPTEVNALPDNLATAARAGQLPDLFAPDSPWLEVERLPQRVHDSVADFRRATRVFLKPASPPTDKDDFVNRPRFGYFGNVAAVALVTQLLVIDTNGAILPTRLTYEIQVRTFVDPNQTQLEVGELSRKLLLSDPKSAGLTMFHNKDVAYMALAGNDYFFASRRDYVPDAALLVSLQERCAACHGGKALSVTTYASTEANVNRPVKILRPAEHERALYVIERKKAREDFAALQEDWRN